MKRWSISRKGVLNPWCSGFTRCARRAFGSKCRPRFRVSCGFACRIAGWRTRQLVAAAGFLECRRITLNTSYHRHSPQFICRVETALFRMPSRGGCRPLSAAAAFSMCSECYQDNLGRFSDYPHEQRRPVHRHERAATRYSHGGLPCPKPDHDNAGSGKVRPGFAHFLRRSTNK